MRGHNIKFNEDLDIFIDWSFVLEFIKYSNGFVRISRFPFYIKGEIYDPFENRRCQLKISILFLMTTFIVFQTL